MRMIIMIIIKLRTPSCLDKVGKRITTPFRKGSQKPSANSRGGKLVVTSSSPSLEAQGHPLGARDAGR